ncbi:MAG TPA: DNA polymerase [Streptosporangiaceae bacterium]|nr:DNA polymerase [Streptosporangiaceae bacterium]
MGDAELVTRLRQAGAGRGDLVGLAVSADGIVAVAADGVATGWVGSAGELAVADDQVRPRWATWSQEDAQRLVAQGVRLATCWDVAAVHRLLFGGWRADPGFAWAHLRGLPLDGVPAPGPAAPVGMADLFDAAREEESPPPRTETPEPAADAGPVGADGYLRLDWTRGGWAESPERLLAWARLVMQAAELQWAALEAGAGEPGGGAARAGGGAAEAGAQVRRGSVGIGGASAVATVRAESTVELLCAELSADGLPMDRDAAEQVLAGFIGPRPRGDAQAAAMRAARDGAVLRHAPAGVTADLRSPVQVRSLLAAAGVEVPDTRAWRLEEFKDTSPLVAALLEWRKAERIATTYGYGWLDESLGPDGRLRGAWTGSDGAAGRMTASNGLHNMPAAIRRAVIAAQGHLFVRADLGQIEPRVLAAVSGDPALALATQADDMYLPVATELGVDRPTAKVAMIAAMYGQTTGHGGVAGRRMRAAYPVAMGYLDSADRAARAGRDLRTYGGRLVRMSGGIASPARTAARGRYGRNALVQGAAAELFKMWAVTVRARGPALGARIVLCLHDELLVHVAEEHADAAAALVGDCLAETARRWAPRGGVRFIAETSVVRCWADAK